MRLPMSSPCTNTETSAQISLTKALRKEVHLIPCCLQKGDIGAVIEIHEEIYVSTRYAIEFNCTKRRTTGNAARITVSV